MKILKVEKVASPDFDTFRVEGTFEDAPFVAVLDFQDGQILQSRLEPDDEDLSDRMTDAEAWEALEQACPV